MLAKYLVAGSMLFISSALALARPASNLPPCVDAESALAEVRSALAANAKSPAKYDGYRHLLRAATPLELATRLAYAETLAANCPARNEPVADIVATVIGNRIRARGGDIASVVFQRDQFASSLNIYPESRFRDFLCPNDGELWRSVEAKMHARLEDPAANASMPGDAMNYYLYLHSPRFAAPAWKLEEVPNADAATRACIRAFRVPNWK